MEAILQFTQRLYRAAQHTPTARFEDLALACLGEQVRFAAALWFAGHLHEGQLQVHRAHAYRLRPETTEALMAWVRQSANALAAAPGAPEPARPVEATLLECLCSADPVLTPPGCPGRERQLLIGTAAASGTGAEWLLLRRPGADAPFDEGDRRTLRLLMPHLSESRLVNRALCLRRASSEPLLAAAPHRALALPEGTVLHCGRRVSEAIGALWPHWDGLRLPAPLLAQALHEGVVPIASRGERIVARRFSDSLVLSIGSVPLPERLTRREYQVIRLLAAGSDPGEVARRCALMPGTVRNIVRRVYRKLGINSKAQLARLIARAEGGA